MFQRPWPWRAEAGRLSSWCACGEVLKAKAEPWREEKAQPFGMCVHVCWRVCSYQHVYTFIKLHLFLPLKFYEHGHMAHYPAMECVCVCVCVCVRTRVHARAQAGLLGTHPSSG